MASLQKTYSLQDMRNTCKEILAELPNQNAKGVVEGDINILVRMWVYFEDTEANKILAKGLFDYVVDKCNKKILDILFTGLA